MAIRFSDISIVNVKEHLRVDENFEDLLIDSYISAAKKYILSYTGLTEEEAEEKEDLSFALLALVGEFYENRTNTVNTNIKANPIVESILSMHSTNYL